MEKFPKGEMGWVNETTVKEYIDRNYVPKKVLSIAIRENQNLKDKFEMVCEMFEETANFICESFGGHALMKLAVTAGFSKEECLEWFLNDEDLYKIVVKEVADEE